MKSIAVIGLGQFGSQVAISMTQKGFDVLAIDSDEEIVTELKDLVTTAVILDSTEEKAMRAVNIDSVDVAVVAIGSNVQASLLTAALLQRLEIDRIYVRAISRLQEGILESMGIKNILNIEAEMGAQLSRLLSSGNVGRHIQVSERHSLMEIPVPENFVGRSLKSLNLRSSFQVNVVGIKHKVPVVDDNGDIDFVFRMNDVPDPDQPLEAEDLLLIMGSDERLKQHFSQRSSS